MITFAIWLRKVQISSKRTELLGPVAQRFLGTLCLKGQNETHSGKLTSQWESHHLKMYLLWKMAVFHCYVSLPEGIFEHKNAKFVEEESFFFSWMVWIYKKTRVIPDSCDVLIARNEEESHIEHLVPTKTPQKMKTPPTKSPSERNWERCLPAFVFDGGFAGWWKRRSISTPLPGGNPLKSRRKWNFFMFVSSSSL